MGIPHLISRLEPFAEHCVINNERVVIDGPAWAYHLYYVLQNKRGQHLSVSNLPSYFELGQAAIEWLDRLRQCGIVVERIYFDGSLPAYKRPTRLDRLCAGTRGLNKYFLSHMTGVPNYQQPREDERETLDISPSESRKAQSTKSLVPASPFIVPAVIEALSNSDIYGPITSVVPGEADSFCAGYVQDHGGIIFTTDSDLVVYDLGPKGSVVLLRDVAEESNSELVCLKYTPVDIVDRLGLPPSLGLRALAFELVKDQYLSLNQLVLKCKNEDITSLPAKGFGEFAEMFRCFPVNSDTSLKIQSYLRKLDPRISEMAIDCLRGIPAGNEFLDLHDFGFTTVGKEAGMFLPTLPDSWPRSTAWGVSSQTRQLAYSLLGMVSVRKIPSVTEYRRLLEVDGPGKRIKLFPRSDLPEAVSNLLDLITSLQKLAPGGDVCWITFALHEDIEFSLENDREPLCLAVMRKADQARRDKGILSWDLAHLVAQIQGSLYSLRILKQLLEFVAEVSHEDLPSTLGQLGESLTTIPPLSGFPSLADSTELLRRLGDSGTLKRLCEMKGIPFTIGVTPNIGGRKKKKSKKDATAGPAPTTPSNNPFDLLRDQT